MGKGNRNRAEREARRHVHDYTQFSEGTYIREAKAEDHPATLALTRRFNEAEGIRQCPHLSAQWDQTRFWVEAVPELLVCAACTPLVAAKEKERANSRCLLCGKHTALRGISVAAVGYLLRGGICAECEKEHPIEASASAPS